MVRCSRVIKPTIIGWREWVGLPELQSGSLLAKIDTGAWSNTMHAIEIEIVEGGLENRVRFRQEDEGPIIERPLHKWRRVRDTGGHESMRPVIRTTLEMASFDFDVVTVRISAKA